MARAMSDTRLMRSLLIGIFLFALGFSTGIISAYTQTMVGAISSKETRGSAMALTSLGWGISHLTTPFAMGVLHEVLGAQHAFYAAGAFTVVCSAMLWHMRRWAFAEDLRNAPAA